MLRNIIWHPVLLALYPSLHLLARNTDSARPPTALVPLALTAGAVLVLWLVAGAALRDRGKAALLASLATVLFFSHGHLLGLAGGGAAVAWLLLAVGIALLATAAVGLVRWRGNPRPGNRILDVAAACLVLMVLVPVAKSELDSSRHGQEAAPQDPARAPLGYLPDIYIIILDGFGRADKLSEIYGVDLSALTAHLEGRGFLVARRADANYNQTSLSLAALLNADYVHNLLPAEKLTFRNRKDLNRLVRENRVVRRLREKGYRLVTLAGGSELAVQADPDVNYEGGALNEFQATLVATTPLPTVASLFRGGRAGALDPYAQHRQGVRYQLAKLPHVRAEPGPKLVFAHIMTPHPPFVIGPDGEDVTPAYEYNIGERYAWDGYVRGYAGQATWLARQLPEVVDGILAASRRPPVILIMGDHGPASRWIAHWKETGSFETSDPEIIAERMAIFLALLMPPGRGDGIDNDVTPVNVFPVVFARCFGEPQPLQDDHSWFSTYDQWSLFRNVDEITGNRPRR
ncbi:MAG: hypothetical protein IH621_12995 [Krumholzibacteria bacterium]|nr:hypothetical protein [Candidatus Krumholzibacteria bacterium]